MKSASLALLAVLALHQCSPSGPAFAHGDASWIMENPAYKDMNGLHCCGPSDCRVHPAFLVRVENEGIYVQLSPDDAEQLVPRAALRRGIYPSINDEVWVCAREGVVKCVFLLPTGM